MRSQSLIALLIISLLSMASLEVGADDVDPNVHLLCGRLTCKSVSRTCELASGDEIRFLFAYTPTRGLVATGTSLDVGEPSQKKIKELVVLCDGGFDKTFGFTSMSPPCAGILEKCDRQFWYLQDQSRLVINPKAPIAGQMEFGDFAYFPFAMFPASRKRGCSIVDLLTATPDENGNILVKTAYGTIVGERERDHVRSISLVQKATDHFTQDRPGETLADCRIGFQNGLQAVSYHIKFDPAFSFSSTAPWTASGVSEYVANDSNEDLRIEYEIDISQFSTELTEIDGAIDEVIARIPIGSSLTFDSSPVTYVWVGKGLVHSNDPQAIAIANALRFSKSPKSGRSGTFFLLTNILLLIAFLCFVVSRRFGANAKQG